MAEKKSGDRASAQRHLRELIGALDRRMPHCERLGKGEIVRAAAALRKKAEETSTLESKSDKSD